MGLTRKEVIEVVNEERNYQDKTWGGNIHDNKHTVPEWILIMRKHLNEAENALYNDNETEALDAVRKITATGIATMEIHTPPRRKLDDDNS